jgi:hypothetical protein
MLTLFTTPVVYLYLDRWNARIGRRRAERAQRKAPTAVVPVREPEAA